MSEISRRGSPLWHSEEVGWPIVVPAFKKLEDMFDYLLGMSYCSCLPALPALFWHNVSRGTLTAAVAGTDLQGFAVLKTLMLSVLTPLLCPCPMSRLSPWVLLCLTCQCWWHRGSECWLCTSLHPWWRRYRSRSGWRSRPLRSPAPGTQNCQPCSAPGPDKLWVRSCSPPSISAAGGVHAPSDGQRETEAPVLYAR